MITALQFLLLGIFGIAVPNSYGRLNPNLGANKILQKLPLTLLQIWGAAAGVSPGPSDLVWKSQRSWGAADTIDVTLIKDDGEVRDSKSLLLS